MQDIEKINSRKKFLLWSAAAISSVTALKFLAGKKQENDKSESNTIKMLTQDGTLVEINKDLVIHSARKITDKELQEWVKK